MKPEVEWDSGVGNGGEKEHLRIPLRSWIGGNSSYMARNSCLLSRQYSSLLLVACFPSASGQVCDALPEHWLGTSCLVLMAWHARRWKPCPLPVKSAFHPRIEAGTPAFLSEPGMCRPTLCAHVCVEGISSRCMAVFSFSFFLFLAQTAIFKLQFCRKLIGWS